MGKKSKKRKRRKISSSSSEEDEKGSKEHDVARSTKKKQDVTCQKSYAAEWENSAFSAVKDAPQSTRQIKKPVYRLKNTQEADQKTVNKEEESTKIKSVSKTFHGGHCSSKAKNDISRKDKSFCGSETVDRESSKPTSHACRVPQRTGETSRHSLGEKSPQRSPSKLRKQLMSPSLVSAEEKKQAHHVLKKFRAEEPPRTRDDSNTVKTRKELVKEKCQRHPESKATRGLRTEANPPSVSTKALPKHFFSSAKHTASVCSPTVVKDVTSVSGNVKSTSPSTANSSLTHQKICFRISPLTPKFKIPKKVQPRPVDSSNVKNATPTHNSVKHTTKHSDSWASLTNFKLKTPQQAQRCVDVTPSFPAEGRDKRSSLSGQLPATSHTVTEPWCDQVQVVEELHLARSEKRLELNVTQSYGELTCMDIDPPEEGAADTHCKQPPQQDLILVLDTNILLSHLDYVKKMTSHGLGAMGCPVVLIPWVVLQELDSLKKRCSGLKGSVTHLATPAITYIYNSLKNREPHLWGQSMQQAAEGNNGLNAENNDDRVLQCCLQYQRLYPECAVILCTNDKNLCSKALLSGVRALSKTDLEAEVQRSTHGFQPLQNIKTPTLPQISPQVSSSPMLSSSCTSAQPHSEERTGLSVGLTDQDTPQLSEGESEEKAKCLSGCVSELGECLREVLSDVLEVEMKAIFEELWLEIVYLKPPWTLQDVLRCLKKHWIAVFGDIVPRKKEQTVSNLIDFFNSGKTADLSATLAALHEAKELVKAFEKSSRLVSRAISTMRDIVNKLQPNVSKEKSSPLTIESPACDVVMNDDDDDDKEDKQLTSAQISPQEVWALFENIWSNVCQISFEVFKALGFDPHTMQTAQPAGGPPPPQDALACLHRLSSMVSQLLQAFSSVLSSAPGLEEVQTLLSIIDSNKIVNVDSRLTAKDLLDCFSQQDYREKLRVGGNQLMELKGVLDCCVGTTGQHMIPST